MEYSSYYHIIVRKFERTRLLTGYEGLSVSLMAWLCHITYVPTLQNFLIRVICTK